uniref:Uncharacterized protein n=1 Tax=Arundo donax TaxID=35708 RepID=A0A0A9B5W8_ARUDO
MQTPASLQKFYNLCHVSIVFYWENRAYLLIWQKLFQKHMCRKRLKYFHH